MFRARKNSVIPAGSHRFPTGTRSSTPTYALWQREIPVPALDKRNGLDHQTRPLGGIGNQRKKRWWWDYQQHKRIEPMEMPYIRGWGGGELYCKLPSTWEEGQQTC